jgi:maleylpyruvate isomerase
MDHAETLADLADATDRMLATVARLTDEDLRGPSRLPGWTRGHVVAHLARNADSAWNLLEWARTGERIPQYPSDEAREAGVAANAGRPAAELHAELRLAVRRLAMQAETMPAAAWGQVVRTRAGWPHPAWYMLNRRWREVEVHHVDLDAGFDHTDWSPAYVRWELDDTLRALRADGWAAVGRISATDLDLTADLGDGPEITGPAHELLGWLSGRGDGSALNTSAHDTSALDAPLPAPPTWPLSPSEWRDL